MKPQKRVEVTISQSSPVVFVGEVLRDGLTEDEVGSPCRELMVRGYWEKNKNKQIMTIKFFTPTCSWKYLPDTVSNS